MRNFEERVDPQFLASWRGEAEEPVTEEWTLDPALGADDFTVPSPNGAPDVLVRMYHFGDNEAARALYRSCGFKPWHLLDSYIKHI
jgi:hypothetical protein